MAAGGVTWSGIRELDQALRVMDVKGAKSILRKSLRKGMTVLRNEVRQNLRSSGWASGREVARAYSIINFRDSSGEPGVRLKVRRKGFKGASLASIYEGGATRTRRGKIKPHEFRKRAEESKTGTAVRVASDAILDNTLKYMDRKLRK